MQSGLLWFDSDPQRGIAAKVADAARRFQEKFGVPADTCYVHEPNAARDSVCELSGAPPGLRIRAARTVLPHHFWIGIEDGITRS